MLSETKALMQTSLLSSSATPPQCFSGRPPRRKRTRLFLTRVCASAKDEGIDDGHRESHRGIVDENMLTLRKRMREIKALDRSEMLHEDWVEWEKEYCCKLYESQVMEMLGLLQLQMMSERPRLMIGMTVMITLSVPTSVLVVMLHLMDVANWILGGVQLK